MATDNVRPIARDRIPFDVANIKRARKTIVANNMANDYRHRRKLSTYIQVDPELFPARYQYHTSPTWLEGSNEALDHSGTIEFSSSDHEEFDVKWDISNYPHFQCRIFTYAQVGGRKEVTKEVFSTVSREHKSSHGDKSPNSNHSQSLTRHISPHESGCPDPEDPYNRHNFPEQEDLPHHNNSTFWSGRIVTYEPDPMSNKSRLQTTSTEICRSHDVILRGPDSVKLRMWVSMSEETFIGRTRFEVKVHGAVLDKECIPQSPGEQEGKKSETNELSAP
jgi:hypothetical protein